MGPGKRKKVRQKRRNQQRRRLKAEHQRRETIANWAKYSRILMTLLLPVMAVITAILMLIPNKTPAEDITDAIQKYNYIAEEPQVRKEAPQIEVPSTYSRARVASTGNDEQSTYQGIRLASELQRTEVQEFSLENSQEFENILQGKIVAKDEELSDLYLQLQAEIENFNAFGEEISTLYDSMQDVKVCSKANKAYNKIQELYDSMLGLVPHIQELYAKYQTSYEDFKERVDSFNSNYAENAVILNIPSMDFPVTSEVYSISAPPIEDASALISDMLAKEEEITPLVSEAKQIADDFFDEYFDLLSHLANAEAGSDWFPAEDVYYVLNVVENRIESPKFPDTLYDVVYAKGQYAPTWNGAIKKTPTEQVEERTTTYLRGLVDTGMPADVVYQAGFPQGDYTWVHMDSGHYFCGQYNAAPQE